MPDMEELRRNMVERQIARRGIADASVLRAMGEVPRERFIAAHLRAHAYDDMPLPVEAGQTISQPYIVARMIEAAALGAGDRVLEVGVGSGYAAAIMSRIAAHVWAIDRHSELTQLAQCRLAELHYDNVSVRTADGTRGWPEEAPFNAIIVSAGAPAAPAPLMTQLAIGGRMVIPVGGVGEQRLIRLIRRDKDDYQRDELEAVRFVPLIGAHGWRA